MLISCLPINYIVSSPYPLSTSTITIYVRHITNLLWSCHLYSVKICLMSLSSSLRKTIQAISCSFVLIISSDLACMETKLSQSIFCRKSFWLFTRHFWRFFTVCQMLIIHWKFKLIQLNAITLYNTLIYCLDSKLSSGNHKSSVTLSSFDILFFAM